MQNFIFENPTKIIFGKNQINAVGKEVRRFGKNALLVYGQGSIKKNGIYDNVVRALQKATIAFTDFPGAAPNPVLSHAALGIETAKHIGADVILAVGGGSAIDTAKLIAAGVMADHAPHEFFTSRKKVTDALPLLTVATVSASASEMNASAVITNEQNRLKYTLTSPFLQPKVSVLDPTVLFSLRREYTAYSAVDITCHMLEGYFNNAEPKNSILQDRFVEGLLKTVMESTEIALKKPDDYHARANIMWSAVLGFNGLTTAGMGRTQFPAHMIGHTLSALYNTAHGATLSIILPAWLSYALDTKQARITRMAENVFGIPDDNTRNTAKIGIRRLKDWYASIGSPTSLTAVGIDRSEIDHIAENALTLAKLWWMRRYTKDVIVKILEQAWE